MVIRDQRRAEFDAAVESLYDAVANPGPLDAHGFSAEFDVIKDGLFRLISVRSNLNDASVEDAISEAIANFIEATQGQRVQRDGAAAYLTKIALNEGANQARRREVPTELGEGHDIAEEDEQIQRLVDTEAGLRIVKLTLLELLEDRMFETVRIATGWIHLSGELRRQPSNREVADETGVTHPTVAHHLRVFAEYARRYL